jgi:hypothetical protein
VAGTISTALIDRIVSGDFDNTIRNEMAQAFHDFGKLVTDELERISDLRENDDTTHARLSVVMALTSSSNDFDRNVRVTNRIFPRLWESFTSVDDVYEILTDNHRENYMAGGHARAIFHGLQFLRTLTGDDVPKLLEHKADGRISGVGPKINAFANALYDQWSPVFTIDRHHLRHLWGLTGNTGPAPDRISEKNYYRLESHFLQLHKELFGTLVSPFAAQWCLWCRVRGNKFESHSVIYNGGE